MYRSVLGLFAAVLVTAAVPAQIKTGSIVLVASANGVGAYAIDPQTGAETTLKAGFHLRGAAIAHGNDHLLGIGSLSGNVYALRAGGTYTTLAEFDDGAAGGIAVDQDASMLLVQIGARRLIRIQPDGSSSTFTTFPASFGAPTAICRDGDTGHFVVGFSGGKLQEVNRETGYKKTITDGLGSIAGVAYVPMTGRYVVASSSGLVFVRRDGSVAQRLVYPDLAALAVAPHSGFVYAVERNTGKLHTVLPSGTPLAPRFVKKRTYRGMAIWGSRIVSVKTSGQSGTTAGVTLRFRRSARKTYCVALSFANRPGIVVGNVFNRINLAPDPLFFLTVCGGLPGATTKFLGRTRIGGIARPSFTIPALPSGTVLYVGAAAINPGVPGDFDFMNSEVVRIE